ncbi:hypothetical protein SmJEL517_g01051 [Synchytrium microbalum]|uniref:tRNA (guanine(9)-N1)-methyltransferase n=1 Tax=Synchytrium microbalum TaxID=1806994 RepID=A0A507CGP6_9FUNG|nr:uncharacterized protein SmJEL517_g01051 [Synchytrium microbalum]TPX37154.1 hypothetical protein SmJEL517_g01051 [Synchytrium microbalum]
MADPSVVILEDAQSAQTDRETTHQPENDQHQPQPTEVPAAVPELSKSAKKKLLKDQAWKAKKDARTQKRRDKKQARKELKIQLKAEGKALPASMMKNRHPNKSKQRPSPMVIAIDLSFEDLMTDKELRSLCKQLQQGYGMNRKSERPARMALTSLGPKLTERLDESYASWKNWKVTSDSKSVFELYENEKLVYLTADSENVLTDLDESKVYIIGGIVDRNRHKNICLKKATEAGIATAQLPISAFISMATRKVLTTNQVVEIMTGYLVTKDWKKSFTKVIPERKGWTAKDSDKDSDGDEPMEGEGVAESDGEEVDDDDGEEREIDNDDDEPRIEGSAAGSEE